MDSINAGKIHAAMEAASLVRSGMVVGLGSGSTASAMIQILGDRRRDEGLQILGVPTSIQTAELAHAFNIPLRDVDDVPSIDLAIDGADEIDGAFRMIKGRGGALLREKIVACAAKRRVIIITPEKRVDRLGKAAPLPVEVSPVGTRHIEARLRALGAQTRVRHLPDGSAYQTDGGNRIIDCRFPGIEDPFSLDGQIQRVVGVYETGLFLGLCDFLIIGTETGVESIESPGRTEGASCS